MQKIFNLTNLTLVVALALSTIAAYYSIIGLTAIFAGAVIPVIVMGSILEIGKIITTVWLRKYWNQASLLLKLYLVPAVVALAVLTSMGIFGFLSKAHMDSGLVAGDVQAKLSLIDEKIKTERENIELARKALQQMDAQVDARLSRSDSEQAAERAVQIRRQQAAERAKLQKEIGDTQNRITKLNEERAPIAAENRKVEAEVGPIKYVAALIYGDNPDSNLLERAVRWLIILLVVVFDPLAIALVLAANSSREWDKKIKSEDVKKEEPTVDELPIQPYTEFTKKEEVDNFVEEASKETFNDIEVAESPKQVYLDQAFKYPENFERQGPMVFVPGKQNDSDVEIFDTNVDVKDEQPQSLEVEQAPKPEVQVAPIQTENVTKEGPLDLNNGYMVYEGKMISKNALQELKPELFRIAVDDGNKTTSNFGTHFPKYANKGDVFVRVDMLPNKVYKFDGSRWIEINKEVSQSYLHNESYIKFLIEKIDKGEYDIESLTEKEKEEIEYYVTKNV